MTILITGSSGHLPRSLSKKFIKLYQNDIFLLSRNKNLKNEKNIILHDLSESKFKIPKKIKYIINCASVTPRSKNKLFDLNYKISSNLLKSINEHGKIVKLINFSTAFIFNQVQKNKIINHFSNNFSNDLYAVSKINSEIILDKSECQYIYHLRIPGVLVNKDSNNFITNLIRNMITNQQLVVFNKLNKFNNVISIDELNLFINNLIINSYNSGRILLGSSNPITIEKLLLFLLNKLNNKPKIIWKNNNKGFHININKTISDYEYNPRDTIQIIETYIDSFFKNYV